MFLKEIDGTALMHIIEQNMRKRMHMNLMKYGGVECVKNIKRENNHEHPL